jgi:hypothetical protein
MSCEFVKVTSMRLAAFLRNHESDLLNRKRGEENRKSKALAKAAGTAQCYPESQRCSLSLDTFNNRFSMAAMDLSSNPDGSRPSLVLCYH